jgi:hypothetical protein
MVKTAAAITTETVVVLVRRNYDNVGGESSHNGTRVFT